MTQIQYFPPIFQNACVDGPLLLHKGGQTWLLIETPETFHEIHANADNEAK